jgi:hypothetical protein
VLPVISLDVIRSSVIFVQKWWPLLKEQDQEQIVKLLGKVNAYPGDFKGNEALATYVGVTGLPGQFRERGGYASAKQNFPHKTGTAAVRDHGITTRRADAAEPSRCIRTRRG